MKLLTIILIALSISFGSNLFILGEGASSTLKGEYLGQKLPGLTPEIFAPGIVSTGMGELASAFSPDGKEFYFINFSGPTPAIICIKQQDNGWSQPQVAAFSGREVDYDPMLSYDGNTLFFCSKRPVKAGETKQESDIWAVDREKNGWSEPRHLGPIVNSKYNEYYPCVTRNKSLYFTSNRKGGKGSNDIYRCKWVDGKYSEPENLGDTINSKYFEGDLFVAADESYIIVSSSNRPDSLGAGDLYISFRQKDGSWNKLKNMGSPINSKATEHCPMVSMDGKVFFFTSYRNTISPGVRFTYEDIVKMQKIPGNGQGDIFWMDAKVIKQFKNR